MAYKLLIPGPVDVDDDVLAALGAQVEPHYGVQWGNDYRDMLGNLRTIFRTKGTVFAIPGSGTAATDAAFANAIKPGQHVLTCANGYFGDRFQQIADGYGMRVTRVEADWGCAINPDDVRAAFKQHSDIDALAVVHVETSTGVINPICEISAIAREHGALVIVDAITGLGGVELAMDDWGIDICVSASQKSLAAPAGLALIGIGPDGWARIEANASGRHGWYLDLRNWRHYTEDEAIHPHPVTVPPGNVRALQLQVGKILAQGLDTYITRHATASATFRAALPAYGLRQFVQGEAAAPMLTLVALPPGADQRAVIKALRERYGLLCSGGFDALDNKVIRVGHMGKAHTQPYLDSALQALGELLN
jgi:alanine-glyoxylate transaminase/serine-glyoxylate transaminase/serine-pyruvate transaminase